MRKTLLFSSLIVIFLSNAPVQAGILGEASNYNAFIFGDMNVWTTDSQGRIAAGGNIAMSNYSVGSHADPAAFSIIGGGNVNYFSGTVANGGIFSDNNVELQSYTVNGDVIANGSVTVLPPYGTVTGSTVGSAGFTNPINFSNSFNYLSSLSQGLASMQTNGTTTVTPWYAISLSGSDSVNYFNIDGSDFSNAVSLTFNMGIDDIAIVNISGTSDTFQNFGLVNADTRQGNILYNFYEADTVSISNIGVKGSVLAPYADVDFNWAHIDGSLIASSLTGTGELHQFQFDHNVPVAPEPVSSTLFILGGATLGLRRFWNKKRPEVNNALQKTQI